MWKSEYTRAIRKFKGKIVIPLFAFILLFVATNYMIGNNIPVAIFRGNHSYLGSGMDDVEGMVVRGMMYLISFIIIFALLVLMPDKRHPFIFLGRNTMGIYFFHYPIMIVMNGLLILKLPQLLNVWSLLGVSLIFVLVLGCPPVNWLYNNVLSLLTFLIFKREKKEEEDEEVLEDEYDNKNQEDKFAKLAERRMAIDELAAMLDAEDSEEHKEYEQHELYEEHEEHEEGQS